MAGRPLARMTVSGTPGTGSVTVGAAIRPWLSFTEAGLADAEKFVYGIKDGTNSETGRGTWNATAGTFTRDTVLRSTGTGNTAKISVSSAAEVYITFAAEDLVASALFPVGLVAPYAGAAAPTGWFFCNGQNVSRTTYAALKTALTVAGTGTSAASSQVITGLPDWTAYGLIGAKVEFGSNFAAPGTIQAVTSNSITVSIAAAFAGSVALTIYPFGNGDGSTTFGLPDLRGRAVFGKDNMGGTAASRITSGVAGFDGTVLGAVGGNQAMHGHNHAPGSGGQFWVYMGGGYAQGLMTSGYTYDALNQSLTSTAGTGNSQNMPPAAVLNKIIYVGA